MNKSKTHAPRRIICATIVIFILCSVLLLTLGQFDLTKVFAADGDTVVYSKAGRYSIQNDDIVADCSQMQLLGEKRFTIENSVSNVKFKGNKFIDCLTIIIKPRTKPMRIVFENMKYRAPLDGNALSINNTSETNIEIKGDCELKGGVRTKIIDEKSSGGLDYLVSNAILSLIDVTNIYGNESSTLNLIGGVALNGTLGGCGFLGKEVHLYTPCTIIGGKGGNGFNGDDGADSTSYQYRGGNGTDGQAGGIGGTAVDAEKVYIHSDGICLCGGNGGNGGFGGDGGNGHRGKDGALFVSPTPGTKGGDGGRGGDGGMFGDFYNGLLYHVDTNYLNSIIWIIDGVSHFPHVESGKSGVGGHGGNGGNGGNGSLSMYNNKKNNPGAGGLGGQGGQYKDVHGITTNAPSGANGAPGRA